MSEQISTSTDAATIAEHIKCPACGAEMNFSPKEGKLFCPYCGTTKEIETGADVIEEGDFLAERSSALPAGTVTVHCSNCGANLAIDKTMSASTCPFCGSPLLVEDPDAEVVVPEAVIPFKVTQEDAVARVKKWVKKRFLCPHAFKNKNLSFQLKGVYIPHFTYDCNTLSEYTAEAGTYYYVTETVTVERNGKQVQEQRQVQHIRWTPVSGTYSQFFDDVLVNASKNIGGIKSQFDFKLLVPYRQEFAAGFFAENNSISKEDCWDAAKKIIHEQLETGIKKKIGADTVRNLNFNTTHSNVKFKEILLPLWILAYFFKEQTYRLTVNGQSGEVKGEAPLSPPKIAISVLFILAITAILAPIPVIAVLWLLVAGIYLCKSIIDLHRKKPLKTGQD